MIKRIVCGAFALCIALSGVKAQAFTAVADSGSKTVIITGELCEMSQNAFLTVVKPGADIDSLNDYNAEVAYVSGVEASRTGQMIITFPLSDNAVYGDYSVNINDGCNLNGHRISFKYSNDESLLNEINDILKDSEKSVSDYESFMKNNGSAFGVDINNPSYTANAQAVWQIIKNNAPYTTKTDVFRTYNGCLSLIELNAASNVSDKQKAFEKNLIYINDKEVNDRYKLIDADSLKGFYENILNKKYEYKTQADSFKTDLLVAIVNQAGRDTIKTVVETYCNEIGIDISPQSKFANLKNQQDVYIALANKKDFKTVDDIKNYFNTLVSGNGGTVSDGGTNGSSNGGSGGKSIPVKVQPNTEDNITDTNSYFNDLGTVEWAVSAINSLYEKGIISGVGDKRFEPDSFVTREEFLKMAVNAFNIQKGSDIDAINKFEDVNKDEWYFPYIDIAVSEGIVNGVADARFGIGEKITRQDMCAMVYRCIKEKGTSIKTSDNAENFVDFDKCSEYSKEAVKALSANNIINGVGENTFAPDGFATRAMAAVIIDRALSKTY